MSSLILVTAGLRTPRASSLQPAPPVTQPRASSQPPPNNKSVQFDIDSSGPSSPEKIRNGRQRKSQHSNHELHESESSMDDGRQHRNQRRRLSHDGSRSPSPAESDATIDLPDRFDEQGRRIPDKGEDPIIDKIEELLSGKGSAGKYFKSLTDGLFGGDEDWGSNGRRRMRRHS